MVEHITFSPESTDPAAADIAALDEAIAQARAEWQALSEAAAQASTATPAAANGMAPYSVHVVEGVGRYIVPRHTGWRALDRLIHDPVANIDFSEPDFPLFDDVIATHFNSPPFLDPADDEFDRYQSLRDNIAAVRNFLLQHYYSDSKSGLTDAQAKAALKEIAAFVGDGLSNNYRVTVLGIPILGYHDPHVPFLSLSAARATGGAGAQYIYDKILEHQHRWDWAHPLDAIKRLFGLGDAWKLPPASATGFTDLFSKDLAATQVAANPSMAQVNSAIMAAVAKVNALQEKRAKLNGVRELNEISGDIDAVADRLLHTAYHMDEISALAKPVRMDAIAEARKILQGLKGWLGDKNILDGLKLKPTDDLKLVAALQGVAEVYTRLLSWGRGVDATILNHPSILAATQAIGQLGYLAKLEALNMAQAAGNIPRVQQLSAQLKAIDARFAAATDATFGGLLGKVENGINVILERVNAKNVPGASASHSLGNDLGSYMSGTPTAGLSLQVSADATGANRDAVGKRNAEALLAEEAHLNQLAANLHQKEQRNRSQNAAAPASAPTRAPAGAGRVALQQAQRQQRQQASSAATAANTGTLSAAQRQQLARNSLLHAAHEAEEHAHHDAQMRQQLQQQAMRDALKKANMSKSKLQQTVSTAGLKTAPVQTGRAPVQPAQSKQTEQRDIHGTSMADKKDPSLIQPPPPPNKGNGRGF